jgi:hypothetical protein
VKLDLALRELHRSENTVTADLLQVADLHKVELIFDRQRACAAVPGRTGPVSA